MKYLVDAQLPLLLKIFLTERGYDAIHTFNLEQKNRTVDNQINEIANREERVVVTKDADFLESYILKKEPRKLLLVKTGNISNQLLLDLFRDNIDSINKVFESHSLIELYRDIVVVHSS